MNDNRSGINYHNESVDVMPEIFEIQFKDPDALHNAFAENGIACDEDTRDRIRSMLREWLTYGEYVTLVLNTEQKTLTVKKV